MSTKKYCKWKIINNTPINKQRRELLTASASALLLTMWPISSQAATVVAVRVWPAEDYTRVTIETDEALAFEQKTLIEPDRVLVDLHGVDLDEPLKQLVAKITPGDPQIAGVRVGQFQPNIVRLVFDLKAPVRPQTFTLKPIGHYRNRLVVDLYPVEVPDPLLALILKSREKEVVLNQNATAKQLNNTSAAVSALADKPNEKQDDTEAFFQRYAQSNTPTDFDTVDEIAAIAQRTYQQLANQTANQSVQAAKKIGQNKINKNQQPETLRLITVAIDPGHGGEDPGAVGPSGLYEKTVVLDIAQRLREKIDKEPNMRAMLTRDADFFVPLHVRVQKARRVGADLFVSIHADAFTSPAANGSSVFALSEHGASSAAARWLANKENHADAIGGVSLKTRDVALSRVLLDMSTTAQIRDSLRYGNFVLQEISSINRLHKPAVEQAGFAVLKAPDIPSILVETAFISNPQEEKRLNDPSYRERMANAILAGIKKYFISHPPIPRYPAT